MDFIVNSFIKATKLPFSYLFFDLHQRTEVILQLKTNIFPDEKKPIPVFVE